LTKVVHLAAGLQFSGFKSVISTLWEVDDSVAKHVVKVFYQNMLEDLGDEGVMEHGLYEGSLGTQPCHAREDGSTAGAEDGFHSYWCVVLRRIAVIWYIFARC
ncbi:hypothetical protein BDR04DRAFT_1196997, partial [Suillus decipiens]